MSYEKMAFTALDYKPCRYGTSKLMFRGPAKSLEDPYIACIGGSETYGKYVAEPFSDLMQPMLDMPCINLGVLQSGPDAYLKDAGVLNICNQSQVTLVQVPNAANLSNRFFMVHPRRNDRFLRASSLLQTAFHDVDFTDFTFVRHMLETLKETSSDRFELVVEEMQKAWLHRISQLLDSIQGPKVLFGLRKHHLESNGETGNLGPDPIYVTDEMLNAVAPLASECIWIAPSAEAIDDGPAELHLTSTEQELARYVMGPAAHSEVARRLADVTQTLIQ